MADRHGGRRMRKEWSSLPSVTLNLTADGTFGGPIFTPGTALTIIRMLGEYAIGNTGTVVAGDEADIGVALGVVSADAAALGASSFPDVLAEPSYPWLYWAAHNFRFPAAGAPLQDQAATSNMRRSFDIRSMRKIKPRESLIWSVQYGDVAGAPPLTVALSITRILVAFS